MAHSRRTRHATFRLAVVAALALALCAGPAGATTGQERTRTPKPTVVLVHGAWADGSSWAQVTQRLQSHGYPVAVPPNPLRGVQADADHLSAFLSTVPGPIVLVGHSYGGMVITNAALGNANVKALVYVDAFAPDQGESVLQLSTQGGSCLGGGGDPSKVFSFVPFPGATEGDVDLYIKWAANEPYPGYAKCFANDISRSTAAVLQASGRPVALHALAEASGEPAWKTIPSWTVIGTLDNVIPSAGQLAMAHRANSSITEVRASHLSLLSRPGSVTSVIESAARSTR